MELGKYRIDAGREMLVVAFEVEGCSLRQWLLERLTELFCAGCVHDF